MKSSKQFSLSPGLCEECFFHREIRSMRGNYFHLCEKGNEEISFPKYPRLPVHHCAGFRSAHNLRDNKKV